MKKHSAINIFEGLQCSECFDNILWIFLQDKPCFQSLKGYSPDTIYFWTDKTDSSPISVFTADNMPLNNNHGVTFPMNMLWTNTRYLVFLYH